MPWAHPLPPPLQGARARGAPAALPARLHQPAPASSALLCPHYYQPQGVREEDAAKVESLILAELARLEKEGFTQSAIEAAVNTIEFSLRWVGGWGTRAGRAAGAWVGHKCWPHAAPWGHAGVWRWVGRSRRAGTHVDADAAVRLGGADLAPVPRLLPTERVLHRLPFHPACRENNTGRFPRGLSLMLRSMSGVWRSRARCFAKLPVARCSGHPVPAGLQAALRAGTAGRCPGTPSLPCCASSLAKSAAPASLPISPLLCAAWIYDRDPFQPMRWQDDLERFKARLERGEDVFGAPWS